MKICFFTPLLLIPLMSFSQRKTKDSIVYRIAYRDTTIYRYDTIRIKHFIHSDTVWASPNFSSISVPTSERKKRIINPNNWGVGPSVGAYYSPFNGFDVNIGFGIQYYLLAIPNFRNPHFGHKRKK